MIALTSERVKELREFCKHQPATVINREYVLEQVLSDLDWDTTKDVIGLYAAKHGHRITVEESQSNE